MTDLYNCKTTRNGWRMTKFSEDLELVDGSSYEMHYVDQVLHCSCPAMARPSCRHREMFPHFVAMDKIDKNWFLEFNKGSIGWRQYVEPSDTFQEPSHSDSVVFPELMTGAFQEDSVEEQSRPPAVPPAPAPAPVQHLPGAGERIRRRF